MTKFMLLALAVCSAIVVSVTLVGRAIDVQIQDRVMFTRDGVTLDCVRYIGAKGNVHYGDCNVVP